ncbi:MAG: type IV pilus modification PilV family protein [Planctomycetota bacterium]|jgi:prepilin-type N-terminal cleavage/methylation domain-containing protein
MRTIEKRSGVPGRAEAAFSLIEVMVAASILAVALVGLVSALLSSMHLRQLNKEKAVARNAAERALSAIRGMPDIVQAYGRFGGGGPEEGFDVFGLAAVPGQQVGRVIVWRRKNGAPPDPQSALPWTAPDLLAARNSMGTPFPLPMVGMEGAASTDYLDTDGDGGVDATDTPSLMPVTVRVRWRSRTGVITQYFSTVVGRR